MDQSAGQTREQENSSQGGVVYACPTCGLKVDGTVTICPRDGSVIADYRSTERLLDNRYQVLSLVASGGMGSIYKARQPALNKIVAVKMLRVDTRNDGSWTRFQQEAKVFSHLDHRNIIKVYDFGQAADGQPFMVMDFIEGANLENLIKHEKTLTIEESLNIFRQICAGMAHAHAHQIYHRDLKPSNIMLSQLDSVNPLVRIVDFGIAKVLSNQSDGQNLTQTGEVFGSPHYMSPEQAIGKQVDARSDIYSLGCIMHETLTGSVPLSGATSFDTLTKHMHDKPPTLRQAKPEGVFSDELTALVLKSLAKDPLKRFQTMRELSTAIDLLPESIAIANKRGPISSYGNNLTASVDVKKKASTPRKRNKLVRLIEEKEGLCLAILLSVILLTGFVYVRFGTTNSQQPFSAAKFLRLNQQEIATPPMVAASNPKELSSDSLSEEPPAPTDTNAAKKPIAEEPPPPTESLESTKNVGSSMIELTADDSDELLEDAIKHNPNATTVIVKGKLVTDDGIQMLGRLKITNLVLQDTRLSERGFAIISELPHLEALNLRQNPTLNDACLAPVQSLNNLKLLDLSQCPNFTDAALSRLPGGLESLSLQADYNLTDKGMADVCKLTNLTVLDVSKTPFVDEEVKLLPKLTKLQKLSIGETCVTNRSMNIIGKLPVRELHLQKNRITRKGLMELSNMPNAVRIFIDGCSFVGKHDREDFRATLKGNTILEPLD